MENFWLILVIVFGVFMLFGKIKDWLNNEPPSRDTYGHYDEGDGMTCHICGGDLKEKWGECKRCP
jgi:hypothetical protein